MNKIKFSKISEILKDAKRGKMFVLVDDESRENEGDLIIPASKVTAKSINFMAKYGRGLICLALTQSQANKLNLSLMSSTNNSRTQTAFTISIDAKKGISTGISAHDRALTIKTAILCNTTTKTNDIGTANMFSKLVSSVFMYCPQPIDIKIFIPIPMP